MALVATAESARDVAICLDKFLEHLPDVSTEITALISECYAISSALRELNTAKEDPRYSRGYDDIHQDVQIVRRSLEYTFQDVHRLFGGLGRSAISTRAAYSSVWRDIDDHFLNESRSSLCKRLEYNRLFLGELVCILLDGRPTSPLIFKELQARTDALLEIQDDRLEATFNNLSLSDPATIRQRSFERRRPPGLFPPASDPPPLARPQGRRPGPQSPLSPTLDQDFPWAPPAPEVPNSPTTTTTYSTVSSVASSSPDHWLPRVFEQSRPVTHLKDPGVASACHGPDLPGASSRLANEYTKLLDLPFENGDLRVRLFHRSSDQRARIHCRVSRNGRAKKQCCLPLTALRVQRSGACLRLCRVNSSGHALELWAVLRFDSYERLVLFYCAFVALRSEDAGDPLRRIDDHELHGEKDVYAGAIIDDNFEHALRLFKDRDSGAIRLQASVLRGELKRTPVWTAFITTHISSRRWMRRVSSKTIYLTDLQRYIFTDEYSPQLGPRGEHELRFIGSEDASDFMARIDELADAL